MRLCGMSGIRARTSASHACGSMWLSLEDTAGRLGRIGWSELTYGDVSPPEKYVERIMALTLADVHRVARRVLGPKRTLAAVGPVRADQLLTG